MTKKILVLEAYFMIVFSYEKIFLPINDDYWRKWVIDACIFGWKIFVEIFHKPDIHAFDVLWLVLLTNNYMMQILKILDLPTASKIELA